MPNASSHSPTQLAPRILSLTPPPHSAVPTLAPLRHLLLAVRLAELYDLTFPDKLACLDAPLTNWHDEEVVVAAIEQFLERTNTLFPIYTELWDADLDMAEWRLCEIPVQPLGFDIWYDEWTEFSEPVPYLLLLLHRRENMSGSNTCDDFEEQYPMLCLPPHLIVEALVPTLRTLELPPPLNALPDLIQLLDQNTGNPLLDISPTMLAEGGSCPNWELEEIEWLTDLWQEAEPIYDAVHILMQWCNDCPTERVPIIHSLLLQAHTIYHTLGQPKL